MRQPRVNLAFVILGAACLFVTADQGRQGNVAATIAFAGLSIAYALAWTAYRRRALRLAHQELVRRQWLAHLATLADRGGVDDRR